MEKGTILLRPGRGVYPSVLIEKDRELVVRTLVPKGNVVAGLFGQLDHLEIAYQDFAGEAVKAA